MGDDGGGDACMGLRTCGKSLCLPLYFCCEPKTAPSKVFFFLRFDLLIFGERRREEEGGGKKYGQEKHGSVASHTPPTGDLAHNQGMCPDRTLKLTFRFTGQLTIH